MLIQSSDIGQYVPPRSGEGIGKDEGIVILASWDKHFFKYARIFHNIHIFYFIAISECSAI